MSIQRKPNGRFAPVPKQTTEDDITISFSPRISEEMRQNCAQMIDDYLHHRLPPPDIQRKLMTFALYLKNKNGGLFKENGELKCRIKQLIGTAESKLRQTMCEKREYEEKIENLKEIVVLKERRIENLYSFMKKERFWNLFFGFVTGVVLATIIITNIAKA